MRHIAWLRWMTLTGLCSALAASCTIKEGTSDDDGGGGEAGSTSSAGQAGEAGTPASGSGGESAAGETQAGSDTGGSATAGTTSAGTGGEPAAGTTGQAGSGEGGSSPTVRYTCEPGVELDEAGITQCEDVLPEEPVGDDPLSGCDPCLRANCCTEWEQCFAQAVSDNPNSGDNECGYGVNDSSDYGEIDCIVDCMMEASMNFFPDGEADALSACQSDCVTPACDMLPGPETNALVGCMSDNCFGACFDVAAGG